MRALIFTFLLISHISVFAQKYTISGYVSDLKTGESVIGANIFSTDYGAEFHQINMAFTALLLMKVFMLFHLSSLVTKQLQKNLI